jgi:hypothetical protein
MDLFDKLALDSRHFERMVAPRSSSATFTLGDVLETVGRSAIHEMTIVPASGSKQTLKPDASRRIRLSLLDDGITAIHSSVKDQYQVFQTAPSGDFSRVKVVAFAPDGSKVGEVQMLLGRRVFANVADEDPIEETVRRASRERQPAGSR